MKKQTAIWLTAVPILTDLTTIIILIWWRTSLVTQFQNQSAINAAILSGVFILFCIAVYFLKKLEPVHDAQVVRWIPSQLLSIKGQRFFGVLFGVALALSVAHQLGYLEAIFIVDDRVIGAGESSAFFVYGPASWLGAGLIYMLILSSTTPPRFKQDSHNYALIATLGLIGVNVMLLLAAAELHAVIPPGNLLRLLPGFLILAVLFLPPRLVYTIKHPHLSNLVSFTILLFVAGWIVIG